MPLADTSGLPRAKPSPVIQDFLKQTGIHPSQRKTPHQLRVTAFMQRVREIMQLPALPSQPTVPDDRMILAQAKLVLEEFLELMEACGLELYHTYAGDRNEGDGIDPKLVRYGLKRNSDLPRDLPHIAKEMADLSVVLTGLFNEFGIADVPILEEVDANNLAKFGPGGYLDENRKWRKPPNHPKPDIRALLIDQGWVEPEVSREEGTT